MLIFLNTRLTPITDSRAIKNNKQVTCTGTTKKLRIPITIELCHLTQRTVGSNSFAPLSFSQLCEINNKPNSAGKYRKNTCQAIKWYALSSQFTLGTRENYGLNILTRRSLCWTDDYYSEISIINNDLKPLNNLFDVILKK